MHAMPEAGRAWTGSSWRFVVVGASNALIGFAVFRACLATPVDVPFKAALSQLVTYAVGISWSFWLNRRWTFRSRGSVAGQAARFTFLQVCFALLSAGAIGLAVDHWGQPASISWLLVMSVVTVLNFLLSRFWAFR
jgi:putative flippase GtrA